MPAPFSSSYSLWPEQARPRSRGSAALVSGGFVAGLVVAMAGNWVLLDASRPTVGSEVVGTAAVIATSTLPPDEGSRTPLACDPKRAPYGIDWCPPAPADTRVRGGQGEAAPVAPARGRSRAAARVRLPIIGSIAAIENRDRTDGRGGGAPPAMVAEELTGIAPVSSGSGVDMSGPAATPETFSRLEGAPAPKLEIPQTTATLEGAGNEAERPTEPVSTAGTRAREIMSGEGPSEKAKPPTKGSKKIMRKQLRVVVERIRRAERRTARRIPASERIRKMPPSPFDYAAQRSYGYQQPRYSYAAQQSYGYQQPRDSYAARQSYHYPRRGYYGYAAQPRAPGLFSF